MRHLTIGTGLLLFGSFLVLSACGSAPNVVQGTVVRYDPSSKIVVIKDETTPQATMELSIADAEVGADPIPGDTVRVAYRIVGDRPVVTRVMNVTRQEEIGKKGARSSGGH
jgi:hypothetical protein